VLLLLSANLTSSPLGAQVQAPDPPARRPGLFLLGPFEITPRLHIGTLGIDTNVFYTAEDRQTDFIASGGPELEIVLPVRPLRFELLGGLDYLFFARSSGLRQFTGHGRARLGLDGRQLKAGVEQGYQRLFDRPNFQVDDRVQRDRWETRADLALELRGRLLLRTELDATRHDVTDGQFFRGANLAYNLDSTAREARAGLGYRLTPKTSVLTFFELQQLRFERGPERDTNGQRVELALEVDSETRLGGRASLGLRWLDPAQASSALPSQRVFTVSTDLHWHFGPRTQLILEARRDADVSAFETPGSLPFVTTQDLVLRVSRALTSRLDLEAFLRRVTIESTAPVTLIDDDGQPVTALRDDRVREAGLRVTQRLKARLRAGFTLAYTTRDSPFADLGISGLLLGGTLMFDP